MVIHCVAGSAALYMFSEGFKRIHELMVFDEDGHRSWFIGSTVLAGLYLCHLTPFYLQCFDAVGWVAGRAS